MIDSVTSNFAGGSLAMTSPASAANDAASAAVAGQRMTPQQAGLGDLTAEDWKLVSAGVGRDVGPDAEGKINGAQPMLAIAIEMERRQGTLGPGQELTVGDLRGLASGQGGGLLDQINNAIAQLEQTLQTSLGCSSGRIVNVSA